MSQATQLIYPTVDLFLYDLHDGLGQDSDQINQNRRRFWQRIYNNSLDDQKLAALEAVEESFSSYVELLGTNRIERFKYPLDGYYYPVKLGDTYAVQIDCSGKENDPDWAQLSQPEQLRLLKDIIIDHTRQLPGDLGETWLVWGKLATLNQDPRTTAEECYRALQVFPQPNWQRDCKGQGTFQGATIFELERLNTISNGFNSHRHLLICLFPHSQTDDELKKVIGRLYHNLIRLFHYRSKVLWVCEQSRQLKNTLKSSSSVVQKLVDSLPQRLSYSPLDLKQLQQDLADALSISHHYQISLGYLQEQAFTIEINAKNYQSRVQTLARLDANSDLVFLQKFNEFATEKYLSQIQSDYQILSAGLKPLETFIKTIEGIVGIEKTKNERTLNQTVAIASVGIGTASLAASTLTQQTDGIVKSILPVPDKQSTPALNYWASFSLAFFLSMCIGVVIAAITWGVLRTRRKR